MKTSFALFAALAVTATSSIAAAAPHAVREGTRPFFATFSLAPAFSLSNSVTQLKIAQSFGWHVLGDSSGPAIGFEIQESFGANTFVLQPGAKFWWDIQLVDDIGFYLAPVATLGLGYQSKSTAYDWYGYNTSESTVGFDMQFGLEAKLILGDRGLVFCRPFTLDIAVGSSTMIRYDLIFGGGVTF